MGKQNVITKQYMQNNARFADLCNFYLFNGKEVIKPEELAEKDVTELSIPPGLDGTKAVEKVRDILKSCCIKTANGITYFIIGLENQTDVHYAMVVRNMLYDALNYSAQVEDSARKHRKKKDLSGTEFLSGFAKDDKLVPVITITIYWNAGSWDGARSLHEMLEISDKGILEYVSDYKLNLVVPAEIKEFEKFRTELGPLFEFISYADNGIKLRNALREKETYWEQLSSEEIDLLNVCLDAKLEVNSAKEKGAGSVCKGIRELEEMSREEGREEGESRLSSLISILYDNQQFEEIQKVISNAEIRKQYYVQYNL